MDNLTEGRLANLAHLEKEKRFRFVKADLRDARAVSKLVKGAEAVFHLAAQANIRRSLVDHMADLENNLIGTINIIERMMKWKVNDLVFASTSAIYGEAAVRPTPECYMPVQTSLYGSSKMACEAYMQAFSQFSDISSWSYRFSNVVGERWRRGVTWDFVKKLRRTRRSSRYSGTGSRARSTSTWPTAWRG
jgi:UDP-glucose 4-epimerase